MALVKLVRINDSSFWAAWKIEEAAIDLAECTQLSAVNLAEWHTIRHPRKSLEWLASRAALAAILKEVGLPVPGLHKDDKGKPYLINEAYHISLANSYPYGVAMVHSHELIGIDIELPSDKLLRTQHKFLSLAEREAAGNRLPDLCAHWCIKEALYKLHGRKLLSFKDQIRVSSLCLGESIHAEAEIVTPFRSAQYHLEGTIIDGFCVMYAVP
jgi:phosphopantetheinyl transferase